VRWNTVPTPLSDGAPGTAIGGSLTPIAGARPSPNTVTTRELDAFLNALPRESLSFLSKSQEIRYDHSLVVGGKLFIGQLVVPRSYVWVLTDAEFYAYGPTPGLGSQPTQLASGALVGLFRLDLLIGGTSPLQSQSVRMSPYTTPSQVAVTTSGWPWLEKTFGVQRMPSFALYASENESVDLELTVEIYRQMGVSEDQIHFLESALPVIQRVLVGIMPALAASSARRAPERQAGRMASARKTAP
jgi:hypothetical protein